MTDRFITVPDSLELPAAVKVPVVRLVGPTGAAATPADLGAATAAQGAKADASDVDQITLTGDLVFTLPVGHPAGQVYRAAITQDGVGGHTVTYNDLPVTVDTTAGAVTTVELHPAGAGYVVRYPVADLDAQVSALAEDGGSALGAYLLAHPPAAAPVESVNGQTGAVVLDAADVGADAAGTAAELVAGAQPAREYRDAMLRVSRNGTVGLRPLFTIIDDDGHTDVIDVLAPILQARSIPAGVAVIGDTSPLFTNTTRRAELKVLQDDHGWEVLSHTMSHLRLTEVDADTYAADCEEFLAAAHEHGFDVQNIVYPYGNVSTENIAITPRYYMGGFGTGTSINKRSTSNLYAINRQAIGAMMAPNLTTLAEFQAIVDSTITKGEWLVLMTHIGATDSTGVQLIADVVDYIIAAGGTFVSPRDGLREFGAVVASGYRLDAIGHWFHIKAEGEVDSSRYLLTHKKGANWKAEGDAAELPQANFMAQFAVTGWTLGNGIVTEYGHASGWQRQEFRETTGGLFSRRWNGSAWREWSEVLMGVPPITSTVAARTIAATSTADITIWWSAARAVYTYVARPAGQLESGIVWNVWSHGNNAITLRLANITGAAVDLAERVWTISAIRTQT